MPVCVFLCRKNFCTVLFACSFVADSLINKDIIRDSRKMIYFTTIKKTSKRTQYPIFVLVALCFFFYYFLAGCVREGGPGVPTPPPPGQATPVNPVRYRYSRTKAILFLKFIVELFAWQEAAELDQTL